MANISYIAASWVSNNHQSILFEGLSIDGEDFGNFLANSSSDLGKQLLKYISDNNIQLNNAVKNESTKGINISKQSAVNNLISWFHSFVDSIAKQRNYKDAVSCISYLYSNNESDKHNANVLNKWRDKATEVINNIINDFLKSKISIIDLEPSIIASKLPPFNWEDAVEYINTYIESTENIEFNNYKCSTLKDFQDNYLKLKEYISPNCMFRSSVGAYWINGDMRSKDTMEALLATATDSEIELRTYSNNMVKVTKEELKIIIKELQQNQLSITKQYWNILDNLTVCESFTDLDRIDTKICMSNFTDLPDFN